jgi:hypothetical protein
MFLATWRLLSSTRSVERGEVRLGPETDGIGGEFGVRAGVEAIASTSVGMSAAGVQVGAEGVWVDGAATGLLIASSRRCGRNAADGSVTANGQGRLEKVVADWGGCGEVQ